MSDEDLFRELLGPEPESSLIPKDRFKPWHRPRKQFIRESQWVATLRQLLQARRTEAGRRAIRYMGLPGEDLLDVRVFHDVVSELGDGWEFAFLGFNASASPSEVLFDAAVRDLRCLANWSKYLRFPLDSVVRTDGPGRRAMVDFGAFDIVNIDLCDGVFGPGSDSTRKALRTIVEHQFEYCGHAWVLFLTSRVDAKSVGHRAQSAIVGLLRENVEKSESFADLAHSEMGLELPNLESLAQVLGIGDGRLVEIAPQQVALGIGKWLLGLVNGRGWKILLKSSYMYSVAGGEMDMVSMAFVLEKDPVVLTDPTGLVAGPVRAVSILSESAQATKMVKPAARMKDVDSLLLEDEALRVGLVERSAELLARAGYSTDSYHTWVESQDSVRASCAVVEPPEGIASDSTSG